MLTALLIFVAVGIWLEPTTDELAHQHFDQLTPEGQAAFRFAQSGFAIIEDHVEHIDAPQAAEAVPSIGWERIPG